MKREKECSQNQQPEILDQDFSPIFKLLDEMQQLSKQELTRIEGFITPLKSNYLPDYETFNTDAVLQELNSYKAKHSEEHI